METVDVLLPQVAAGIRAGAMKAIETARRCGTKLVIWRDGKVMEVSPDEAEALVREKEAKKQ